MRRALALTLAATCVSAVSAQPTTSGSVAEALARGQVRLLEGMWTERAAAARASADHADGTLPRVSALYAQFLRSGNGADFDSIEHALYNGAALAGAARADRALGRPPAANVTAATLEQLAGLIYAQSRSTIFVGLFVASKARARIGDLPVRLTQRTRYPGDGDVELRVEPERAAIFTLALRVPEWARGKPLASSDSRFYQPDVPAPTLFVNAQTVRTHFAGGFARVTREWRPGDVVHLHYPMPVHRVLPLAATAATGGSAAIQRGPLIYAVDAGARPTAPRLPLDADLSHEVKPGVGNIITIAGGGLIAVPYYTIVDRAPLVWIPTDP